MTTFTDKQWSRFTALSNAFDVSTSEPSPADRAEWRKLRAIADKCAEEQESEYHAAHPQLYPSFT